MTEEKPRKIVQATAFQRFTIRLVDGKFVRIPKADLPSVEVSRQSATSNQTEIRELFRLVNGRFTRLVNLDPTDDACVGKQLPVQKKSSAPAADTPIAKNNGNA